MFCLRYRMVCAGLMLATALGANLLLATPGRAYTADQQQACSGDAFRLCSSEIPDVDRITVCMVRNKSQLSPGCRVFFGPESSAAVTPVAAGRPLSITPPSPQKPPGAKSRKSRKPS